MPLWVALTAAVTGITAPNTSLATVPVGYFGGNAAHRGNASIEMLAKCRIVMIEKWEVSVSSRPCDNQGRRGRTRVPTTLSCNSFSCDHPRYHVATTHVGTISWIH